MFLIGDKILHPMHGAGVIDEIVTQKVSGVTREYYVMHVSVGSMKVMIPVTSCGEIGVRPVLSAREADEVIASLAALHVEDTANWNRRYRESWCCRKTRRLPRSRRWFRTPFPGKTDGNTHKSAGKARGLFPAAFQKRLPW